VSITGILIGLLVFLLGCLILANYVYERHRAAQVHEVGEQLGMTYHADGDLALAERIAGFQLFAEHAPSRIWNLLYGDKAGMEYAIFDEHGPKRKRRQPGRDVQTLLYVQIPEPIQSGFLMRPRVWDQRGRPIPGYAEVTFDAYPTFSEKYALYGQEVEEVRRLFRHEALTHLGPLDHICAEGRGTGFLYFRAGERVAAAQLHAFLEEGFQALELFRPQSPVRQ